MERRALRFGAYLGCFAAATLAALLVLAIFVIASIGHCTSCDPGPAIRRELTAALGAAAVFGAIVAIVGAVAGGPVRRIMGSRLAIVLFVAATIAAAIASIEPLLEPISRIGYPPEPQPSVIAVTPETPPPGPPVAQ